MVVDSAPFTSSIIAWHGILIPAGIYWRQTRNKQVMSLRRGYTKPLATSFAESAKNRESVMALGSIAHVQHYFARTGLLDGKGAGCAAPPSNASSFDDSSYGSMTSSPLLASSVTSLGSADEQELDDDDEPLLPPTTSTYSLQQKSVPPPPTLDEMRRDLCDTLDAASKALASAAPSSESLASAAAIPLPPSPSSPEPTPLPSLASPPSPASSSPTDPISPPPSSSTSEAGWHEIQGLHLLDTLTMAIKSARAYYTSHPHPARLSFLKSDRRIREDLFGTLEVLKRMASRNFAGGVRRPEHAALTRWVEDVLLMLEQEMDLEAKEARRRENWAWLDEGVAWEGRAHEREWMFLSSFLEDPATTSAPTVLPQWRESSLPPAAAPADPEAAATGAAAVTATAADPFLDSLRSGIALVKIHNSLVAHSKKRFGTIERWHEDVDKPYRAAENLRFWIKAAEIRWEIRLSAPSGLLQSGDVLAIVRGEERAMEKFGHALEVWCRGVREEISAEAREGGRGVKA